MAQLTVRSLAARVRALPSSVLEPEQSRLDPILDNESRWEPFLCLNKAEVPYKIWTEQDVFKCHGLSKYRDHFRDPYAFQESDIGLLVNDLEGAAAVLEGSGYFRTRTSSAELKKMGYTFGDRRSFIRLLNVSAIVREYTQWESLETITTSIAYAADAKGTHYYGNLGSTQTVGNGVLLMLASDWNYTLPANGTGFYYEPIPELSEYFDSHVSLWMDASRPDYLLLTTAKIQYYATIVRDLVCDADDTWTIDFEKDIKRENHQALFDILETQHQRSTKEGVDILTRLLTDIDFQAYSRNTRDWIKAGVHEPTCPPGLIRYRVRNAIIIPLPRGQAKIRDEKECKKSLPRFSWLCRAPGGDGWFLLSLNLVRILANRKEMSKKTPQRSSRKRQPERTPDQHRTLEYYLQDILADTENWAYQEN